jgi:hypothetical protein
MYDAVLVKGTPDSEKRSCFDCQYCQGAISWWCTNDDAREERGTSIPGCIDCPHWEPCKTIDELGFFEKYFGVYIKIEAEGG